MNALEPFTTHGNAFERIIGLKKIQNVIVSLRTFSNLQNCSKPIERLITPLKTSNHPHNVRECLRFFRNFSEPLKTKDNASEGHRTSKNVIECLTSFRNFSEMLRTYRNASEHPLMPKRALEPSKTFRIAQNLWEQVRTPLNTRNFRIRLRTYRKHWELLQNS